MSLPKFLQVLNLNGFWVIGNEEEGWGVYTESGGELVAEPFGLKKDALEWVREFAVTHLD